MEFCAHEQVAIPAPARFTTGSGTILRTAIDTMACPAVVDRESMEYRCESSR